MNSSEIKIKKPNQDELKKLGIENWSPWSCNPSEFDWEYDSDETAYVKKGKVVVTPLNGQPVEINAGDLVTFPKGMKCKWKVIERIEKVYTFD